MELVQEHGLPGFIPQRIGKLKIRQHPSRRAPKLRLSQGKFTTPVERFGAGLGGVGAAVGLEIQLAGIGHIRPALLILGQEEVHWRSHPELRHALQIPFPPDIFQMFAGRSAAAIAMPKWIEALGEAVFLQPFLPALDHSTWIGLAVVIVMEMGLHPGTVNPFPDEGVVGELLPAVISPKDLLGREIFHPAAAHDLRQRAGITKDIRQPEQFALHTKFLPVKALAVNQLANQAFTAADIGIRLHPGCPIGDPLPAPGSILDLRVELRVMLLNHPVEVRLALQENVFGIAFHQVKLGAEGPHALALGLGQRPKPGHVDMRVPKADHLRRGIPVVLLHQRSEALPGCHHRPQHGHQVGLEIDDYGEILETVINLHQTQRFGVDVLADIPQGFHIHQQLIDRFHPDPKMALPDLALLGRGFRHGLSFGWGRSGMPLARSMPGIGLQHDREGLAGPG